MEPKYLRFVRSLALLSGTALGACTTSHLPTDPNPDWDATAEADASPAVDAGTAVSEDASLLADASEGGACTCSCFGGANACPTTEWFVCGCPGGGGPLDPPELAS